MNDIRIIIPLSAELLVAVEDFRFRNRIPSRAEAVRRLLASGVKRDDSTSQPHQDTAA
jgi:metal-responsive CopG/Arc/MetJ family transcriptional regulator